MTAQMVEKISIGHPQFLCHRVYLVTEGYDFHVFNLPDVDDASYAGDCVQK